MDLPPLAKEWLIILVLWSLAWKIPALWKAARRGDKVWYGIMMVVGTLGILEYIYIYFISKKKKAPHPVKRSSKK